MKDLQEDKHQGQYKSQRGGETVYGHKMLFLLVVLTQQARECQKYIKKMTSLRSSIDPYMKFELLSCFSCQNDI